MAPVVVEAGTLNSAIVKKDSTATCCAVRIVEVMEIMNADARQGPGVPAHRNCSRTWSAYCWW